MPRSLTPHDVFAFRSVADPRIASEGGRVIATVTRRDIATDARVASLMQTDGHAAA